MKKSPLLALTLLVGLLANAQTKNFIDQPYIEVAGNADTLVIPNEIYLRIFISEKDTRDRTSVEELEQKMVATLTGLGVNTEKDLNISDMTSNFRNYLLKGRDIIKSKLYILKVTDAVTAAKVIINLEEAGISNTGIERVGHSDLNKLRNKMRTNAMLDAKETALALTKPLNQALGTAIRIADTENISQQLQGQVAGIRIRGISSISNKNDDLSKIDFEKIKVSASVNVVFILK